MIGCHRFSITVLLIVAAIAHEIAEVMKQEVYKLWSMQERKHFKKTHFSDAEVFC